MPENKNQQALAKTAPASPTRTVAPPPAISALKALLERSIPAITMAIPSTVAKYLTPARITRITLTSVARQPMLLKCSPESIVKAVIEASELGLEISSALGQAYLVPRWNSRTNQFDACFQIGYRGFIELAGRSGLVKSINAAVVYDCDVFEFEMGLTPKLRHVPASMRPQDAQRVCVWAVALLKNESYAMRVLWPADVYRARSSSESYKAFAAGKVKSSPWKDHEDEMWIKTAIRSVAKITPLSPELMRSAVADEYREQGTVVDVPAADVTRLSEQLQDIPQLPEATDPDPDPEDAPEAPEKATVVPEEAPAPESENPAPANPDPPPTPAEEAPIEVRRGDAVAAFAKFKIDERYLSAIVGTPIDEATAADIDGIAIPIYDKLKGTAPAERKALLSMLTQSFGAATSEKRAKMLPGLLEEWDRGAKE